MTLISLALQRADLVRTQNFIAGQWRDAGLSASYNVSDPATGEQFARVPDSTAADAHDATDAAQNAFEPWRFTPARERAAILKRWHALIVEHSEDLARLMSREQGKPMPESRAEVLYGAAYVEWFAEEAVRTYGDIIPEQVRGRKMMVVLEPVGVVAVITPWNFPLAMIARKLAPALAAGCTVVAKPAEDTPLTALALVRLAENAGVPAGVLNIVTSSRAAAPALVNDWIIDPRVRKVSFTGSTEVGKLLARGSADTLKKLSLELGGNAPFVVFDDADVDAAVEGLVISKFRNSGQTCVCPNRVYVQDAIHDVFSEKLAARMKTMRVGPATRDESQIGPLINERAVEKVERHVKDAVSKGAALLLGGTRVRNDVANGPFYFAPTLLANATADMMLFGEETFGPVVPLFRFATEAEGVRAANDTQFGLASYFYARDVGRISRVAELLQAGIVGINVGAVSTEVAPFGGVKESGYGREGSRRGIEEYMQTKYVCLGSS
ncbi:MAG: succinate-semialdehyde dehydrogenase [Gemmatimonadetes bacterium]|nr:succinate-semialdehyde dehydrogenase [Gemmatimonadota bacterium]